MTIASSLISTWPLTAVLLQLGSTPVWVPLIILLLIILLFWWGLTRNRIPEENSPAEEHEGEAHSQDQPDRLMAVAEELDESQSVEGGTPEALETAAAVSEAVEENSKPDDFLVANELAAPVEPDDLKLIEGIGPKISSVLADAGIVTFAQLAAVDPEVLEKAVREDARLKLANPESWPEQARLAAEGRWDELEELQENLKGGVRKE